MQQHVTIVMYHYIRDFARTRYPGIKGLDIKEFHGQLDFLQNEYTIITIEDLIGAHRTQSALPDNAALLTFDDGYAEHYELVFPELYKRKIQGCFFPPVDPVVSHKLLDVNRVHFILASSKNCTALCAFINQEIETYRQAFKLDTIASYEQKWKKPNRFDDAETIYVKRMLQTALPEALRNKVAAKLFAEYVTLDEEAFASELYISKAQAELMQSCGMYFGSHGKSHYWLNQVSRETQENEIAKSLDFLREIGSPVNDFWVMCYPFGGWNESLLDILRQYKCTLGLTTEVATADLAHHDILTLPRLDTNDLPKASVKAG